MSSHRRQTQYRNVSIKIKIVMACAAIRYAGASRKQSVVMLMRHSGGSVSLKWRAWRGARMLSKLLPKIERRYAENVTNRNGILRSCETDA